MYYADLVSCDTHFWGEPRDDVEQIFLEEKKWLRNSMASEQWMKSVTFFLQSKPKFDEFEMLVLQISDFTFEKNTSINKESRSNFCLNEISEWSLIHLEAACVLLK